MLRHCIWRIGHAYVTRNGDMNMHAQIQITPMFNSFIACPNANNFLVNTFRKNGYIDKYFEIIVILILFFKNMVILKKKLLDNFIKYF